MYGTIWHNGKLKDFNDVSLTLDSHALHYGTSCFDSVHSYETKKGIAVFRMQDHLDRLFHSASALHMDVPFQKSDIEQGVIDVIRKNNLKTAYIRPFFYYHGGTLREVFPSKSTVHAAIMGTPLNKKEPQPLSLMTSSIRRITPDTTIPGTKFTGLYVNSLLAMHEARSNGFDNALMLDHEGKVAEGPSQNIFIIKNNELITPDSASILKGVMRNTIIALANHDTIPCSEKEIKTQDVLDADEAFFTGTLAGFVPITSLDKKPIGSGTHPIFDQLQTSYQDALAGEHPKSKDWLKIVN